MELRAHVHKAGKLKGEREQREIIMVTFSNFDFGTLSYLGQVCWMESQVPINAWQSIWLYFRLQSSILRYSGVAFVRASFLSLSKQDFLSLATQNISYIVTAVKKNVVDYAACLY